MINIAILDNKKIKDFKVSKSTFYRKISKFRNTNIFLLEDRQQYDQIFVGALWLWYIFDVLYLFIWCFARKLNNLNINLSRDTL